MTRYLVRYHFDVWGNADDGWQVNDSTVLGSVEIDESKEHYLEDYVDLLKPWFDPKKVMSANPVLAWVYDGHVVIDLYGIDHYPFVELLKEEEDESNR